MFLSRVFGRSLFAAARSESSAASFAAAATATRGGYNPLQEFFEADRSADDDKPVVYGMDLLFASVFPTFTDLDICLQISRLKKL